MILKGILPLKKKTWSIKRRRIICFDYMLTKIRIYKLINNNFILDLEFLIENEGKKGPASMCEIEDNIILFGGDMKLDLIDIKNKEIKYLQSITFNNDEEYYIDDIIKLTNGEICTYKKDAIIFYKYETNNQNLEKLNEITIDSEISKLFKISNGNIIIHSKEKIIIYDKNKSVQTRIKIIKILFIAMLYINIYFFLVIKSQTIIFMYIVLKNSYLNKL